MTFHDTEALSRFIKHHHVVVVDDEEPVEVLPKTGKELLAQIRKKARGMEAEVVPTYTSLLYIPGTSNRVERLFSTAKNILEPHRSSMLPRHVENLLFLKCNRNLWGISTISTIYHANPDIEK